MSGKNRKVFARLDAGFDDSGPAPYYVLWKAEFQDLIGWTYFLNCVRQWKETQKIERQYKP
jgi:hypothetical protein